jgi:hypothetical protein
MYKVWTVFDDTTYFAVVNSQDRMMQSRWKDYLLAKQQCSRLNTMIRLGRL